MATPRVISCLSNRLFPNILLVIKEQTTIGNVEAIAYSYEPVSYNTKIIAVIGAPITELETAAIPDTANTDNNSGFDDVMGNWKTIAPSTPPKKRAGENVPPKKPKPIQIEVSTNFPIKRIPR